MSAEVASSLNRRDMLLATATAAILPLLPGHAYAAAAAEELKVGRDQAFDFTWKFFRGAGAFEAPDADDSQWRTLDLPHDWSIEDLPAEPGSGRIGPFDPRAPGGTANAFSIGGEGWYRKHFNIGALPPGSHVTVLFDGVYMESDVWLNGHHLGRRVHGYTPFHYDLTPHLRPGDNVLAVRVRNDGKNSRWYTGSGIYRRVTIDVVPQPARVEQWGVAVATRAITDHAAEIEVQTQLAGATPDLVLVSRVRSPAGVVVAESQASGRDRVSQSLDLPDPALWSPDTPVLYSLETELRRGSAVLDRVVTPFGVRVITFDATNGMQINGLGTKLRGGCLHHDNGLLGAAAYPDADDRRVRLLKARGYNAIRSSHYPASRSFRQACDRHGVMLIDEAFDMWRVSKNPQDYANHFAQNWQADIAAMVLSARNSPSVVMWSIGNEIPGRSTPEGVKTSWDLANAVRQLDPTRPVTAGINGFLGRPVIPDEATARKGRAGQPDESAAVFLDVVGYNYRLDRFDPDHLKRPDRVMYGSESYPKDLFAVWDRIDEKPYLIGDFVWSAMDYLGEAGMGTTTLSKSKVAMPSMPAWPWVINNPGDLDITGGRKAPSYARDVAWRVSPLEVAVQRPVPVGMFEHVSWWGWSDERQSWTWPGHEGQPLAVRVYTRADRVELRVNGAVVASKSLGRAEKLPIELTAPYAPGTFEAVAYSGGREVGRRRFETVGLAAALQLIPEAKQGSSERGRLTFVRVEVQDSAGRTVQDAIHQVSLNVSGPARLIGFGSGNPHAVGSFQAPVSQTFEGRALAILCATGGPGTIRIKAQSAGLRAASAVVALR